MERLSHKEILSVLEFLRGCYAARDVDRFACNIITKLPKLIGSDITGYNEVDPRGRKIVWVCDPADVPLPDPRIFEEHMQEHPIINYHQKTKDGRARKISDFLTRRKYHRLDLYNEFYRKIDVEHQIAIVLPTRSPHIIGIALNRTQRDFTERERLILNLIRPHLLEAYRNAQAAMRVREELNLMTKVTEVTGVGAVVLKNDTDVQLITTQARQWLRHYFADHSPHAHDLPKELQRWLEQQKHLHKTKDDLPHPAKPLLVEREGKRLVVRMISDANQTVLILKEQRTAPEPKDLEALGLSPREAEVLFWIAQGKTNEETGSILSASARTVGKHLERIYQKLGVETRTAAAMLALTFMG